MASHCPLKKSSSLTMFYKALNRLAFTCFSVLDSYYLPPHSALPALNVCFSDRWFPKCGPWPSSTSIPWNWWDAQILQPQTYWTEFRDQATDLWFNKPSRWFWGKLKFEILWPNREAHLYLRTLIFPLLFVSNILPPDLHMIIPLSFKPQLNLFPYTSLPWTL